MQDMKLTKKEAKKQYGDTPVESTENRPKYPWGLTINLEDDSLKKLDMEIADYTVGDKLKFECEASVSSIEESQYEGSPNHQSIRLQVRKMEIL